LKMRMKMTLMTTNQMIHPNLNQLQLQSIPIMITLPKSITKFASKPINPVSENKIAVKNSQDKRIYSKIVPLISVLSVVKANSHPINLVKPIYVKKNVMKPLNLMKLISKCVSILLILNTPMAYGVIATTKKKMKILTKNIVLGICVPCVVRLYQSIYLKILLKLKSNNVLKNVERNT